MTRTPRRPPQEPPRHPPVPPRHPPCPHGGRPPDPTLAWDPEEPTQCFYHPEEEEGKEEEPPQSRVATRVAAVTPAQEDSGTIRAPSEAVSGAEPPRGRRAPGVCRASPPLGVTLTAPQPPQPRRWRRGRAAASARPAAVGAEPAGKEAGLRQRRAGQQLTPPPCAAVPASWLGPPQRSPRGGVAKMSPAHRPRPAPGGEATPPPRRKHRWVWPGAGPGWGGRGLRLVGGAIGEVPAPIGWSF